MTHNEKCNLQTLGTPNFDLKDPHWQEIIRRRQIKMNLENLYLSIFDIAMHIRARSIYWLLDIACHDASVSVYMLCPILADMNLFGFTQHNAVEVAGSDL